MKPTGRKVAVTITIEFDLTGLLADVEEAEGPEADVEEWARDQLLEYDFDSDALNCMEVTITD